MTSLLADADALDRVRLGDLDPRYLHNVEAQSMAGFAQALFDATDGIVPTGDAHFAALWPEAVRSCLLAKTWLENQYSKSAYFGAQPDRRSFHLPNRSRRCHRRRRGGIDD
jgi:hypothetical protein